MVPANARHEAIEGAGHLKPLAVAQVGPAVGAAALHLAFADGEDLPARRAVQVTPVGKYLPDVRWGEAQATELAKGRGRKPIAAVGARAARTANQKRGEGPVHKGRGER